jgi:hypothetical protein
MRSLSPLLFLLPLPLSSHNIVSVPRPQVRPFSVLLGPGELNKMAGGLEVQNKTAGPVEARVQYRVPGGWQLHLYLTSQDLPISLLVPRGSVIAIRADHGEIWEAGLLLEKHPLKSF